MWKRRSDEWGEPVVELGAESNVRFVDVGVGARGECRADFDGSIGADQASMTSGSKGGDLMKRILAILVFVAWSSMAQAAFIQCSPGEQTAVTNGIGSLVTFTCNPGAGSDAGGADDNVSGDGYTVTTLRLRVNGTFTEGDGPLGQIYAVLFTTANSTGLLNASCTATGAADANGDATGSCLNTSGSTDIVDVDAFGPFTVLVTAGAGSTPLPFSASTVVSYEVTAILTGPPPSTVLEPGACVVLANGVIGLYALRAARRRRGIPAA